MCRLIPLIFFPRVVTPLSTGSRRLDGLAVDAAGTGLGLFADRHPDLISDRIVNPLEEPASSPLMEVVAHRPFRREVMRQGGPGTSGTQDVEDRIENLAEAGGPRRSGRHPRRQQRFQDGPLSVAEVTGIRLARRGDHEEYSWMDEAPPL
jgi:hypothetical protein